MSLKVYNPTSTQDIFALAQAVYGDPRGVNDILRLNTGLDLDAESYFGEEIVYDDAIAYETEVFVSTPVVPQRAPIYAKEAQTIYDLALEIYNDLRGVQDILRLNPDLDLEAETYFGEEIAYDEDIAYEDEVFTVIPVAPRRQPWKTRQFQSVYDLAVQLYGDVESLEKVLRQVTSLDDPQAGTEFETEQTDNILANTLFSRKIVATSDVFAEEVEGGIGWMIIESTFIVG